MPTRLKIAVWVCVFAAALAIFMRYEAAQREITGAASTCRISERWDCDAVQTSYWGTIFGVSTSTWGAAGNLILLSWLLVSRHRPSLLVMAGSLAVLNLFVGVTMAYIASVHIGALCLYCTILQLTCLVTAVLVVPPAARKFRTLRSGSLGFASLIAAVVVVLAVAGDAYAARQAHLHNLYRPYAGKAVRIDIAEAMVLGDPNTPHSVLIYFSFGCPRCRHCYDEAVKLVRKYDDKIHFIFKHWPLDKDCNPELTATGNPAACRAAVAGQAAAMAGHSPAALKYFFDIARRQEPFSRLAIEKFGKLLKLTDEDWQKRMDEPRVHEIVARDVAEGNALNYIEIPVTYVDGRRINPARLAQYVERICK